MLDKVFEIFKDNLKNPKFYFVLLILIVVILLFFPYIDANFFYYNRVERRIQILKEISELEIEELDDNQVLQTEYYSIIDEISKQKDGSLGSIFVASSDPKVNRTKYITGAVFFWLLGIISLFIKQEKKSNKVLGLVFFVLIGIIFGMISTRIPIIKQPMYNYICIPLIEIVMVGLLITNKK